MATIETRSRREEVSEEPHAKVVRHFVRPHNTYNSFKKEKIIDSFEQPYAQESNCARSCAYYRSAWPSMRGAGILAQYREALTQIYSPSTRKAPCVRARRRGIDMNSVANGPGTKKFRLQETQLALRWRSSAVAEQSAELQTGRERKLAITRTCPLRKRETHSARPPGSGPRTPP